MSDELFEKFNMLNTDEPEEGDTQQAGGTSADAYSALNSADPAPVEQPAEQPAPQPTPERPAYQPQSPSGWQTPYYSAPVSRPDGEYNPYVARPVSSAPAQSQPAASYTAPSAAAPQQTAPANTYVDSDGYYHRSFTERPAAAPAHSAPPQRQKPPKKEKARMPVGAVAVIIVVCMVISGFAGFGGSYLFNQMSASQQPTEDSSYDTVSDQLVIHKVDVEESTDTTSKLVDKSTDVIVGEVADSVVEITTEVVQTNSFYGQYVAQGAGSGVIISEDGYIVTNNHVIEGASNITVTLRNGESYEAKLVGRDPDEDVALIKVEASDLTMAIFGDSDDLQVGDKSIIIGNPLGTLGGSVTEGILSALDRSIVIDGKTMHLMQTDAAINPGNSGGGMFNGQGELVGIVVAKSGGSTSSGSTIDNIGFVIPINNVLNILGDLKQYGYSRGKADTGMSFVDITNRMYAWYYYNSSNPGVFINSVDRGSNAEQAGFRAGDRIISVDGKTISECSEITAIIAEHSVGDTITFELERNGRTGSLELVLEEYVPETSSSSGYGY